MTTEPTLPPPSPRGSRTAPAGRRRRRPAAGARILVAGLSGTASFAILAVMGRAGASGGETAVAPAAGVSAVAGAGTSTSDAPVTAGGATDPLLVAVPERRTLVLVPDRSLIFAATPPAATARTAGGASTARPAQPAAPQPAVQPVAQPAPQPAPQPNATTRGSS